MPTQSKGNDSSNTPSKLISGDCTEVYDSFLSTHLVQSLEMFLVIPAHGLTSAVGVVTNLLNLIVLARLGLKSSTWVGGFALSLTDLAVTCLQLAICCCNLLRYVYSDSSVDLWMLGVFAFGWTRIAAYYSSMWITTVISVERCCCVVSPFTVKRIFTRARCVVVIMFIYLIYISLVLPVYIIEKVTWRNVTVIGMDGSVTSRLVLSIDLSEDTAKLEVIVDAIGGITLFLLSQIVLLCCTLWMIYALMMSSRSRHPGFKLTSNPSFFTNSVTLLSNKEVRLIKVVLCLAIVQTVCNMPRYAVLVAYYTIPEMDVGGHRNLSALMWSIADFFGTANCSTNFLVYWILNEKFRHAFWCLFLPGRAAKGIS